MSNTEILRTWSDWARRLKLEKHPTESGVKIDWMNAQHLIFAHSALRSYVPQWSTAQEWRERYDAMVQAETRRFEALLVQSRAAFSPLSDPLDTSVQLHRRMSWDREEVYSDWFQWVLLEIGDTESISRVLGATKWPELGKLTIDRETNVEHGFANQSGRLDLKILSDDKCTAVVEVKTRSYEAAVLEKHAGYKQSVETETDLIFVAVDPPESMLHGFRFLAWKDICLALRCIARRRLKPEQTGSTALILVFVAAVEQRLLGFDTAGWHPAKLPAMAAHLTRFLESTA